MAFLSSKTSSSSIILILLVEASVFELFEIAILIKLKYGKEIFIKMKLVVIMDLLFCSILVNFKM